jgi:hypothetical protein
MFNETAYNLALEAGCPPNNAVIAAAVAQAESGGNASAHNPVPPDDSYGLWQINMLGPLGPARRAQFGLTSNSQLYDPQTNARAMFAISGGCSRFTPWTTYTSGAYRQFLGAPQGSGTGGYETGGEDSNSNPDPATVTTPIDLFSGAPAWLPIVAIAAAAFLIMK